MFYKSEPGVFGVMNVMKLFCKFSIFLILSTFIYLVGCDSLKEVSGRYTGIMIVLSGTTVKTYKVEANSRADDFKAEFVLIDYETKSLLFNFKVKSEAKVLKVYTDLFNETGGINLVRNGLCGEGKNQIGTQMKVCLSGSTINFIAESAYKRVRYFIYLTKGDSTFDLEVTTKDFSLRELVTRAKKNNLENLLKAERVYQARQEILINRGNLSPRLNIGTFLAMAEGPMGLVGQIGQLLPFIFPSNWYQLDSSKNFYSAERYSYGSLVLNQINIVEELYYLILRDQKFLEGLTNHMDKISRLHEFLLRQEEKGVLEKKEANFLENHLLRFKLDKDVLEEFLTKQFASLSRAVSLPPSRGISGINSVPIPEINDDSKINVKELLTIALSKSLELKELVFLSRVKISQFETIKYLWLDPSSDSRFGIGFGLSHALNISRSSQKQVGLKRKMVELLIEERLKFISATIDSLVSQYGLVREGIVNAEEIIDREKARIEAGGNIHVSDIQDALEDLLQFGMLKSSIESSYLIVVSKLDRLLLRGFHKDPMKSIPGKL